MVLPFVCAADDSVLPSPPEPAPSEAHKIYWLIYVQGAAVEGVSVH